MIILSWLFNIIIIKGGVNFAIFGKIDLYKLLKIIKDHIHQGYIFFIFS
jgi:hypothetical protein